MNQVQDSSDCCINSKFSSAQKGYFQDDYLSLFIKKLHPRSPIINRGYYIRFRAVDEVFLSWLSATDSCIYQKCQIISLGAGYDSSYIRLKNNKKLPPSCHYIEIDFPDVMKRKYELIKNIVSSKKDVSIENNPALVFCSEEYSMLGIDLTNIPSLKKCFNDIGLAYDIPTLFISECSITYIDSKHSETFISWVHHHFLHSVFVAYEQVYPDDAFGLIMRNHFNQVGCSLKSITKYPDEESQCERFKKLGWSDCRVITMYNFFNSLSHEEKHRIQKLEMFDEYEMWHEKCHHYIVLWASQGIFSKCLPPFLAVKSSIVHSTQNISVEKILNWKYIAADELAQRFGHQVIPISSSVIMISGGFGIVNKRHQRLGDISLYNIESKECVKIPLEDQKHIIGSRMFHTMTKLSNDSVVILGGRSSPKKVFEEVLVLCSVSAVMDDKISLINSGLSKLCLKNFLSSLPETNSLLIPVPTWRHSATLVDIKGTDFIVIFGGCSQDHIATNGCFLLDTETWKWSKVNDQEHTPCPRHSHSAVTYNKSSIIVTGGLTEEETILQSIHLFDAESLKWSELAVSGLFPRYSHTAHVWKDYMFLIGGVTSIANFKLAVGVVNLKTLQAFEVNPPAQDPEYPILFCNHSSYIQGDEIFIVGGGGNCFSFGTHFNRKIVSFNVNWLL